MTTEAKVGAFVLGESQHAPRYDRGKFDGLRAMRLRGGEQPERQGKKISLFQRRTRFTSHP